MRCAGAFILVSLPKVYGWPYDSPIEQSVIALAPERRAALIGSYKAEIDGLGNLTINVTESDNQLWIDAIPVLPRSALYQVTFAVMNVCFAFLCKWRPQKTCAVYF